MLATSNVIPMKSMPMITIGVDIRQMVEKLEQAIIDMTDGPKLFQRAHRLVGVEHGGKTPAWLSRHTDAPSIAEVKPGYIRQLATEAATCVRLKTDKYGQLEEIPVLPPMWLIEALQGQLQWKLPMLEGVVCAPVLCSTGEILTQQGYHENTGLYLDFNGTTYPEMPRNATKDDAHRALYSLTEAFEDFPFVHPHHFSAAVAALLTPLAQYGYDGRAPGIVVEANTPGTGKGLLVDVISTVATGLPAACWAQTEDAEEERKRLLAIALAGDQIVHIDNITTPLGSGPLDSAMTAGFVAGRLLGGNETEHVPIHTLFFFSGNNISYQDDMARRLLPITLDARVERPEERSGFTHQPLLKWVACERPRLIIKALTILSAFVDADAPEKMPSLGSYEGWSDLVRSAVVWCGGDDPCEGRKEIQRTSNPDVENLQTLLELWHACYDVDPISLNQMVKDFQQPKVATNNPILLALRDALGAYDPRFNGTVLNTHIIGNALRSKAGRVIGDKRLVRYKRPDGKRSMFSEWQIEIVS